MNRFDSLEAFVAVVDSQGFSAAGDKLGIAKSVVSRRVGDLERRLGVQLLHRTTRRQSLTETGQEFYARAVQILDDLNDAEEQVSDSDCRISGKIKLALPMVLGVDQLVDPLSEFLTRHPDIKLDVDLNDRSIDLISENVDLAIRIGELEDSSMVARRLSVFPFDICASAGYLEKYGRPKKPEDLNGHHVLVYSNVSQTKQWSFRQQGKLQKPTVRQFMQANNGEFLAAMACRGQAIVSGPRAYLQKYIESGDLIRILENYTPQPSGIYALYPPGRKISRRVRMLSDALRDHFRAQEA
ncbi:MAG: LysR family transcriptional regulator [Pseudomonadota bacterium]